MPFRVAHMVCASLLTSSFVVAGISALYLFLRRHTQFARTGFSIALMAAAILAPLQILLGDMHGLNTREVQPTKLAAIEGRWTTRSDVPLTVFALPDQKAATNHDAIEIPYLGSIILTHSLHGTITGLRDVPADQRPPVAPVFFAFRIMAGVGFAMFTIAWFGLWLRRRKRLFDTRWFHALCALSTPLGFIAVIAGWTVTEVGRQPWTVFGMVRTSESVSALSASDVGTSILGFFVLYNLILVAFLFYAIRLVVAGPRDAPALDLHGLGAAPIPLPAE
jgi:cytochrome d ubiquinol oxidase subunit I